VKLLWGRLPLHWPDLQNCVGPKYVVSETDCGEGEGGTRSPRPRSLANFLNFLRCFFSAIGFTSAASTTSFALLRLYLVLVNYLYYPQNISRDYVYKSHSPYFRSRARLGRCMNLEIHVGDWIWHFSRQRITVFKLSGKQYGNGVCAQIQNSRVEICMRDRIRCSGSFAAASLMSAMYLRQSPSLFEMERLYEADMLISSVISVLIEAEKV
jgi:hypothetical protein